MDMGPVLKVVEAAWPPVVAGLVVWPLAWLSRIGRADRAHAPVKRDRAEPYWVAPVLLGLAAVVMHWILFHSIVGFPTSAADWRPHIAFIAMIVGMLGALTRARGGTRWVVRIAAIALAGHLGVIARVRHLWAGEAGLSANSWGVVEAVAWLGLFVLVTCAAWWCLERTTDRTRGVSGPAVLCAWCFAASQVLSVGLSNLKGSLGCVVLAGALAAAIPIALWRPRLTLAFGGATVPVIVCAAAIFQGMVWAESSGPDAISGGVKALYVLLLLLAAVLPLAADIGPLARMPDGRRTFAKIALAAFGAMLCAGVSFMLRPPPLE